MIQTPLDDGSLAAYKTQALNCATNSLIRLELITPRAGALAQFNAEIGLKVNSSPAERQIRKVEKAVEKVESTSRKILGVDKRIVQERRKAHDPRCQRPSAAEGGSPLAVCCSDAGKNVRHQISVDPADHA